jgi:signal transduction histidine kinase
MPPDHVAFWDQYLLKVFRTGSPDRFEFGLDGPEGRHYESRLVPERDRDGGVETVLSITRDITDRKRAERQLLASREELRALVARLNSVREEEKARLSRELHDEMGQLLTALRMELEALEDGLGDVERPAAARELLDRAVAASELVAMAIDSMRNLLASLRPVALDRLGLGAALSQECRRFKDWAGIACEFAAADGLSTFGAQVDTALFRIAQEALTNVARHAGASRVAVTLERKEGMAVLRVADDGRGVPAGREAAGLGVLGMRERAECLGGELVVKPVPRGGAMVEARIPPCAPANEKGAP